MLFALAQMQFGRRAILQSRNSDRAVELQIDLK